MVSSWQQMREGGAGQWCQLSGLLLEWEHHYYYSENKRNLNTGPETQPMMKALFLTFLTPTDWALQLSKTDTQRGRHQERFVNTSILQYCLSNKLYNNDKWYHRYTDSRIMKYRRMNVLYNSIITQADLCVQDDDDNPFKTNKQIVKDAILLHETVHLLQTQESKSAPSDVVEDCPCLSLKHCINSMQCQSCAKVTHLLKYFWT